MSDWPTLGSMKRERFAQLAKIASTDVLKTRTLERALVIDGKALAVLACNDERALVSRLVEWHEYRGVFMFVSYATLKMRNRAGDVAGLLVEYKGETRVLDGTAVIRHTR